MFDARTLMINPRPSPIPHSSEITAITVQTYRFEPPSIPRRSSHQHHVQETLYVFAQQISRSRQGHRIVPNLDVCIVYPVAARVQSQTNRQKPPRIAIPSPDHEYDLNSRSRSIVLAVQTPFPSARQFNIAEMAHTGKFQRSTSTTTQTS